MPTSIRDTTDERREFDLYEKTRAKAPGVRDELEEIIKSDREPNRLRIRAISMLARNFTDCFPGLLNLLGDNTKPLELRNAVLESILANKYTDGVQAAKEIIANTTEHRWIRGKAFSVLAELDPIDGHALLIKAIQDHLEDEELRAALISGLNPKHKTDDQKLLIEIAESKEQNRLLRTRAIRRLQDCTDIPNDLFIRIIKDEKEYVAPPKPKDDRDSVKAVALDALAFRPNGMGKDALWQIYHDENKPQYLLRYLARHASDYDIRQELLQPIIQGAESVAFHFSVDDQTSWKEVAKEFIEALINSATVRRSNIDAKLILRAIQSVGRKRGAGAFIPSVPDAELVDFLIEASLNQDERMTGIIAQFIIEACKRDLDRAGDAINAYQNREKEPSERLEKLRIQVGGQTALGPLMDVTKDLKKGLEETFRKPIRELNTDTKKRWEETIKHAKVGFTIRNCMSVIVFVIGAALLITSAYKFLFSNIDLKNFAGPGISFISGFGMMLAVVYRGPLREIKQSVNDIGMANVAFIGYIHRILEVSHTFEIFFVKEKIDFEELTKSNKLIQEAMQDTISLLGGSVAMLKRNQIVKEEKNNPINSAT